MSAISSFNKNMLFVSVVAVSFLFAGRCYCQDAVLELSLEKTIEMAIDSSEAVKIRENDISKSKAVYRETRSAVLPHVNGSASWEDNLNYPVSAAGQIRDYGLTAGVTASQLLWSFGSVMTAVNAAKKTVDASKFSRDASIQEIVYIAKLSYYSALLAENTLKIAEASYDNSIKRSEERR
jgi:outer membrane protein TolC